MALNKEFFVCVLCKNPVKMHCTTYILLGQGTMAVPVLSVEPLLSPLTNLSSPSTISFLSIIEPENQIHLILDSWWRCGCIHKNITVLYSLTCLANHSWDNLRKIGAKFINANNRYNFSEIKINKYCGTHKHCSFGETVIMDIFILSQQSSFNCWALY